MRQFKGDNSMRGKYLKDVPKGVCPLCGGEGRFRTTYKHKSPIISKCWRCSGTGKVMLKVKYTGEMQTALWTGCDYVVITEADDHYVIVNRDKELVQVEKDDFELITY